MAARERLQEDPLGSARSILLVPEQASLQMERALLEGSSVQAFSRVEVLSFRRLAVRILAEVGGAHDTPLTPIGRHMVLRHLLGRLRPDLKCYARVLDRSGFVSQIAAAITELMHEQVDPAMLGDAAGQIDANSATARKVHDLALIYRAYLDYLDDGPADPERYLDWAAARLKECPWALGCELWVDGFAGFTRQESALLAELARLASRTEIALLLDPSDLPESSQDDAQTRFRLFSHTERTFADLSQRFAAAGLLIDEPRILNSDPPPRFAASPILARLERGLFSAASASPEDSSPASAIELFAFANRRLEVEAALSRVQDLVRRPTAPLRYRDIALVVRDLDPYHDLISAACAERNIPVFIDRRQPVSHHPLVELLRALCLLGVQDFSREPVSLLIKTGLIPLADDPLDQLENYVLAFGICGSKLWLEREWGFWPKRARDADDPPVSQREQDRLRAVNRTRHELLALLGEWPALCRDSGTRTGSDWVASLRAVLRTLGVADRLEAWAVAAEEDGLAAESMEHRQVLSQCVSLLQDLERGMGAASMDLSRFLDVLGAGLGELTLGLTPPTVDQLLVGSIERSRHPTLRAVLLLGCNERVFPRVPTEPQILNHEDRDALADASSTAPGEPRRRLGPSARHRLTEERLLGYIALTRATDSLWISYARSDEGGRELFPSPFIEATRDAVPGLRMRRIDDPAKTGSTMAIGSEPGLAARLAGELNARSPISADDAHSSRRAAWNRLYAECVGQDTLRPRLERALASLTYVNRAALDQQVAQRARRDTVRNSVSRLETFAACPFRHFAHYGLRLDEREEHHLEAIELGTLSHDVLERFVSEVVSASESLGDLDDDSMDRRLRDLAAESATALHDELLLSRARNQYLIERCATDLARFLRGQRSLARRSGFRPRAVELGFGMDRKDSLPSLVIQTPKGRRVELRGIIDRVDLAELTDYTLLAVIDYKRQRNRLLSMTDVFHGLALQLVGYLLALRQHGESWLGRPVRPAGAFYLSLLQGYESVDHPTDAKAAPESRTGGIPVKPRGLFDANCFDHFDSQTPEGRSPAVAAFRKKDGSFGFRNSTDDAEGAEFNATLDHVHRRIAELADRMLDGDIDVAPARLGTWMPCTSCAYRPVCRFDFQTNHPRTLERLSRTEALDRIVGTGR